MTQQTTRKSSSGQGITVTLQQEKETKNTVRYDADDSRLRTIYLTKEAFGLLGSPESIEVTIKPAK